MSNRSTILDRIRFQPEKEELDHLVARYLREPTSSLDSAYAKHHNDVVVNGVRITEFVSPVLWKTFREALQALEYDEPIELFVENSSDWNAHALWRSRAAQHRIILTSGLVRHSDPAELRFVIGHEIGHLAFDSHLGVLLRESRAEDRLAPDNALRYLKKRLSVWSRWSEHSSDRAGFIASHGDLKVSTAALIATASGLSHQWINPDPDAIHDQFQEVVASVGEANSSHPAALVRVAALHGFAQLSNEDLRNPSRCSRVDESIRSLLGAHDDHPTDSDLAAVIFSISSCILATRIKGTSIHPDAEFSILTTTSAYHDDPRSVLKELNEERNTTLKKNVKIYGKKIRDTIDDTAEDLLVPLVEIIAIDGVCQEDERRLAHIASEALGLGTKTVDAMIRQRLNRGH